MSPEPVLPADYVRPEGCVCPLFRDVFPFRMADLTCPVHGVGGSEPGDGYWEQLGPLPLKIEDRTDG